MSSTSMSFGRPARLAPPSASGIFVGLTAAILGLLRRLDRSMLDAGRDEPRNAAEVLAWARRIENTEPGLAADLRAAVWRSAD